MKTTHWFGVLVLSAPLALAGCTGGTSHNPGDQQTDTSAKPGENQIEYYCPMHPQIVRERPDKCPICAMPLAKREATVIKLTPEDRRLVEAQVFCPIREHNHLGTMGIPFKIMVKGEPVFLCCEACQEKALADPDKTLEKVKELKAKVAPGSK